MSIDLISLRQTQVDILDHFRNKGYTEAELEKFCITDNELIKHTEGLTEQDMITQKLALVMFDQFMSTLARTKNFTELVKAQKSSENIQAKKTPLTSQDFNESFECYNDDDQQYNMYY